MRDAVVKRALPLVDSHCHIDFPELAKNLSGVLDRMRENGVGLAVCAGVSIEGFPKILELVQENPQLLATVGVHPEHTEGIDPTQAELVELAQAPEVIAIGETGLDYYWHKEKEEHLLQQKVFRQQMDIAREKKLPFMIHSRDAAEDTLNIVKEYMKDGMYGGIIHCFSYSKEIAREYLNMGLYLGIGGVITFKNSRKLKEVVEYAPLNQILLETDCPYMAPVPNRGKRNSSLYLPEVVKTIAELKGVSCEEVVAVTESNAMKVLGLI